jgi:ATP-dependent DNA helicase RecQ
MNIDRKFPLEDIAKGIGVSFDNLLNEIEVIVASGTKVNLDYCINEMLDEEAQEEIYDYFMEDAETDSIEEAYKEFDEDYSEEELRVMRIKFMSEMAN